RQLKKYFREAQSQKGDVRESLKQRLETRLDNVIFRLGWSRSRAAARQLVNHGHVLVNGHRLSIPSYQVKKSDVILLHAKIKKSKLAEDLASILKKHEAPSWLLMDKENLEAKVLGWPEGEDLGDIAVLGLIVESYSR
ncbi:MAG: 30S ribosomal protein S4, partial [Patescibacteria group bacterium]